jgi:hypothetical protein
MFRKAGYRRAAAGADGPEPGVVTLSRPVRPPGDFG